MYNYLNFICALPACDAQVPGNVEIEIQTRSKSPPGTKNPGNDMHMRDVADRHALLALEPTSYAACRGVARPVPRQGVGLRGCGCQARVGKRIQCPVAPAKRGRRRRHHRPDPRSGRTAACRSKFLPKPRSERCRGAASRHAQGMALSIRQAMELGAVAALTVIELGIRLWGGAPDRAVQLHAAMQRRQRTSLSTYRPDAESLDIGHREAVCAEICRWIDALEANRWFAGCPINLNSTLERRRRWTRKDA